MAAPLYACVDASSWHHWTGSSCCRSHTGMASPLWINKEPSLFWRKKPGSVTQRTRSLPVCVRMCIWSNVVPWNSLLQCWQLYFFLRFTWPACARRCSRKLSLRLNIRPHTYKQDKHTSRDGSCVKWKGRLKPVCTCLLNQFHGSWFLNSWLLLQVSW